MIRFLYTFMLPNSWRNKTRINNEWNPNCKYDLMLRIIFPPANLKIPDLKCCELNWLTVYHFYLCTDTLVQQIFIIMSGCAPMSQSKWSQTSSAPVGVLKYLKSLNTQNWLTSKATPPLIRISEPWVTICHSCLFLPGLYVPFSPQH